MTTPLEVLEKFHLDFRWILSQAVVFLILYWLVKRFLFPVLLRRIQEREERVRAAIEQAEKERQEMERLRKEYEEQLAHIHEEARARLHQAMEEAYQAREALLAQARESAERLHRQAMDQIALEREKLLIELRDYVAELSVRIAEKVIERSLTRDDHHEMINDILEKELKEPTVR
ncbi:MAG: F0F1 ATP synthase subunit B [Armatimonadetes bacterium]|nr:F0F1 ATP synthase subunit B [Armatimonadota bacterium]MDW8122960.1 F0F1 ATP synthase subunit B [Armatimonadota bacterium]